jgi:hypothetical protein
MKIDKKNLILSTVAGLALIVIGYLVWKHEEVVSAANADARSQQDAADQAAYATQLQQELTSMPLASGGGYSNMNGGEVPGNETAVAPVADDTELNAILSAFFPATRPPASTGATQPPPATTQPPASTGAGAAGAAGPGSISVMRPVTGPINGPVLSAPGTTYKIIPLVQQGGGLTQ